MATGGIERVWWEGRSLLDEDVTAGWFEKGESRWIAARHFSLLLSLFLDERMALRLYRIMAMTKLC